MSRLSHECHKVVKSGKLSETVVGNVSVWYDCGDNGAFMHVAVHLQDKKRRVYA